MKKTYIAPALHTIELNLGASILDLSMPIEETEDNTVDDATDAWTRKHSGWDCSDWSDNE